MVEIPDLINLLSQDLTNSPLMLYNCKIPSEFASTLRFILSLPLKGFGYASKQLEENLKSINYLKSFDDELINRSLELIEEQDFNNQQSVFDTVSQSHNHDNYFFQNYYVY